MKTKFYLNHQVNGYYHQFSWNPDGVAPEEVTVELPAGVEEVTLCGGRGFEFNGETTYRIYTQREGGSAWPYLVFHDDNGKEIYKNLKVLSKVQKGGKD